MLKKKDKGFWKHVGSAASVILLHAYPVTLVLNCAGSRCLRFQD
jgi:hypothetical protein